MGIMFGLRLRDEHSIKRIPVSAGSKPARIACSPEIASNWKPSRSRWPVKSAARFSPVGSLPNRTFVSALILRADRVRAASSESYQSNACASSRTSTKAGYQPASSLEGKGSKKAGPTTNLPFSEPGRRLPLSSPTGTRRTTGFDPLAMITSSPLDAL